MSIGLMQLQEYRETLWTLLEHCLGCIGSVVQKSILPYSQFQLNDGDGSTPDSQCYRTRAIRAVAGC